MLALYLASVVAAVVTFYGCRRLLLERVRVERPDLFPTLHGLLISTSILDAFSATPFSNFLKERLDELGLQIDVASKIWLYVGLMRVCLASLYLIGLVIFLSVFARF